MPILKKIKEDLKAVSNIETITRTYQEIANLRMNEIRQKVLNNREFIEELSQVYTLAKKAYLVLLKKEKPFIKPKRERVVVFLSGNERFYGTLFSDIWRELLNYLAKNKADLAVVGRMGKYLAERSGFGHKMFYFELNDDKPEKNRLREIIDFIKNYEEIIIFHGRFQTILSQKVVQSNISGGVTLEEELEEVKSYLFEPSPEAVLEFFETELLSAFFNQTILEHRLSKYTNRRVAMYQATKNAKKRERKLKIEQKKIERQLLNRKQIELYSGSQLWT